MSYWIFGILAALFGVLGLVLASHALDIGMFTFGLGLVAFAIVYIFWLVKDHYDQSEKAL